MTDRFDRERPETAPEEMSLDELLRSTREDLERYEALVGETPQEQEDTEPPAAENPPVFEPQLPREYAELDLETPEEEESAPEEPEIPSPEELTTWRTMSPLTRTFVYVASVILASLVLAVSVWILADDVLALTGTDRVIRFTVSETDTVDDIADRLENAGFIRYKWLFQIYCTLARAEEKILPGTYELNDLFDYHALVNGMAAVGERSTTSVMVPEGYTCEEIFALLEKKGVCTVEKLREAAANEVFDYDFLVDVPMGDSNRLEGCLFPDTYEFYVGDNPRNVLNKFLRNTDRKLTDELWAALDKLNASLRVKMARNGFTQAQIAEAELTMHDVLIVASLIEKEAANAQESTTVASVIYNRLCSKTYPCLCIDATIQYALPERKETLTQQDTLIDSPYNTYKYPGLPVGAISNPGVTSIRGALYPKDTDYFFYALGKSGLHSFFRTYSEHLAFQEELRNG